MHDLRAVRDAVDALRDGMRRRGKLDALGQVIDRAVEVARRKKAGQDAADLIAQGRALGEEIGRLERELAAAEAELQSILLEVPNVTLPEVPDGGEEANTVVRSWGTPRPAESVKPHWEVGETLGILDLARGAKIAGSGFIVLRGAGARLARALMNFMIDLHTTEHGYDETWVPFVVN